MSTSKLRHNALEVDIAVSSSPFTLVLLVAFKPRRGKVNTVSLLTTSSMLLRPQSVTENWVGGTGD